MDTTLVPLLGETRAAIVDSLRAGGRSAGALAEELGLAEAGIRRHLALLERDGLIAARTVRRPGRGRPGSVYELTERGRGLYPDRTAAVAEEALTFLEEQHGREGLVAFLRWRAGRHEARYAAALAGASGLEERAGALAEMLDADGFAAVVQPGERGTLVLAQGHCAIRSVAEAHPEVCAHEAAVFSRVLGARVSRRETIATGAPTCVCTITPRSTSATEKDRDVDPR